MAFYALPDWRQAKDIAMRPWTAADLRCSGQPCVDVTRLPVRQQLQPRLLLTLWRAQRGRRASGLSDFAAVGFSLWREVEEKRGGRAGTKHQPTVLMQQDIHAVTFFLVVHFRRSRPPVPISATFVVPFNLSSPVLSSCALIDYAEYKNPRGLSYAGSCR